MKKVSFESMKLKLEKACETLRSFTLARPGLTEEDGIRAIDHVLKQCKAMDELFRKGPYAARSTLLVAAARTKVLAAKARLSILGFAYSH